MIMGPVVWILLEEADIGDADPHQLLPQAVRGIGENLPLHLVPLLVDVVQDGENIVVLVLKMLVGSGAGNPAVPPRSAGRKSSESRGPESPGYRPISVLLWS